LRSVSTSITAACDSGQSDSRTGDDDDNVFAPSAGKVLNVNCGPIHRRLCGPAWVIISTYDTAYISLKIYMPVMNGQTRPKQLHVTEMEKRKKIRKKVK